jgi:sterol 3beta-glucosyltransferase
MKIYIAALGSRGDNEPFRAMAWEAAAAGHDVYFGHTTDLPTDTKAPYREMPIRGSFESLIADQGVSVTKALKTYKTDMKPLLENAWEDVNAHIHEVVPDIVVYHPKLVTAPVAAHHVGAIAVIVEIGPTLTPTKEFAAPGWPFGLPRWLNKFSFSLIHAGLKAMGSPARTLAKELGVINLEPDLTLCPVSPTLLPQPADWPAWAHVTGHWSAPVTGGLDPELEKFLSSGIIVYAGLGSMKDGLGAPRAAAIVEAARAKGMKTLLVTGWGGLVASIEHSEANDVLVRESVPHPLVLPKVHLAVHHGGAGTTHAALSAGVPSVIMPFLADQPWWARLLHNKKLGPQPLSRKIIDSKKLAKILFDAIDYSPAVREARDLIRVENGLGHALTLLEQAEAGILPLRPPASS